jgi:hypothetical protein
MTRLRSNMKNKLVEMQDAVLWRKRGVIESVNKLLSDRAYTPSLASKLHGKSILRNSSLLLLEQKPSILRNVPVMNMDRLQD